MAIHSSILAWRIPWSLTGYSPWGHKELDMTEQLTVYTPMKIFILKFWENFSSLR